VSVRSQMLSDNQHFVVVPDDVHLVEVVVIIVAVGVVINSMCLVCPYIVAVQHFVIAILLLLSPLASL